MATRIRKEKLLPNMVADYQGYLLNMLARVHLVCVNMTMVLAIEGEMLSTRIFAAMETDQV